MSEGCSTGTEEDNECCVEQVVLSIPEVFVYKVPPLRTASGHRAEEWGLATPLFTGYLRVLQADTKLRIIVYAYRDPTKLLASDENLTKFGECPVAPHGDVTSFVDSVIDSSRYYVLRIKDPASSRTTLLGIGFREREVAFDFKSVLNEYVRYVDRMDDAKKLAERRAAGDDSVDVVDLSLPSAHEGQEVSELIKAT
jgi:adaptin ear-binding coat-associated protein 1/2